ncbi:MAG: hypothetical protein ACKO6N_20815 [Myxococcota bacterium]
MRGDTRFSAFLCLPAWISGLLVLTLVLGAPACKSTPQVDPLTEALTAYKTAVEPALAKNEELSKIFVQLVNEGQGKIDSDAAAKRLESELLPKAKEFSDLVNTIQVTDPQVQALHEVLVKVAKLRLEGYQQVVTAYNSKMMDQFTEGRTKLKESKIMEEDEFAAKLIPLMASHGLELTLFATPAL